MLPTVAAGATQQFHALPACVEELDFDALENVDFQVEDVKNSVDEEVIKQLLLTPDNKWQEFFEKIGPASNTQCAYEPPAGLMFDSAVRDEGPHKSRIPVIPLSVQQAQLDNLDTQVISQPGWMQDDVQLSLLLDSTDDDDPSPPPSASLPQLAAAQHPSPDQTVPFRRHDSTCSMVSSCSEVKTERRSLSESDSKTPFLPFTSTTSAPEQLFSNSSRRGRPCSDDVSWTFVFFTCGLLIDVACMHA